MSPNPFGQKALVSIPKGVGEILRRVVGKCFGWVLKNEIQTSAGLLQVATGLKTSAETVIWRPSVKGYHLKDGHRIVKGRKVDSTLGTSLDCSLLY